MVTTKEENKKYYELGQPLDGNLTKALNACGFNGDKQKHQNEINSKIMEFCTLKKPQEMWGREEGAKNNMILDILPFITHKDTYFGEKHVRIQGLIDLDYLHQKTPNIQGNVLPGNVEYVFIKGSNYLYVPTMTFKYL